MKRPSLNNCRHGVIGATCVRCFPNGNILRPKRLTIRAAHHAPGAKRPSVWYVESQSSFYAVQRVGRRFYCQCHDFFFRRLPSGGQCKHIRAVRQYLSAKRRRQPNLAPLLRASIKSVKAAKEERSR